MKWSPIRIGLRAAIAPFLVAGAMGTALIAGSGTASAAVNENLCTKGGGYVHTTGTNGSTIRICIGGQFGGQPVF